MPSRKARFEYSEAWLRRAVPPRADRWTARSPRSEGSSLPSVSSFDPFSCVCPGPIRQVKEIRQSRHNLLNLEDAADYNRSFVTGTPAG